MQMFFELGRTSRVRAIAHSGARFTMSWSAADRTLLRHLERFLSARPPLGDYRHDLGNDVSCPLHDDRVANSNILASDLVFVVQGGPLHGHTTDIDRDQDRQRIQRSGPA